MPAASLGSQVAEFIADAPPIPDEALEVGTIALQDSLAVGAAGATTHVARLTESLLSPGSGPCVVIGRSTHTDPLSAAWANGTAMHALDYDDMSSAMMGHPSAVLMPALLAAAEIEGFTTGDVLKAFVVGHEVAAFLGMWINPGHYTRGWHATSTLGRIGAAAAVARLYELDAPRAGAAVALAATGGSGLRRSFGTDAKPLHAGAAARDGLAAALLARAGAVAKTDVLDGPGGFMDLFSDSGAQRTEAPLPLGERWLTLDPGIAFKLYPSCGATHVAVSVVAGLLAEHAITSEEVREVVVSVHPLSVDLLRFPHPATPHEARFSMEYCIARAIHDRRLSLGHFEPSAISDPGVAALRARITMIADEDVATRWRPGTSRPVKIEILTDRSTFTREESAMPGGPLDRQPQRIAEKIRDCLHGTSLTIDVQSLAHLVANFEAPVTTVMDAFSAPTMET